MPLRTQHSGLRTFSEAAHLAANVATASLRLAAAVAAPAAAEVTASAAAEVTAATITAAAVGRPRSAAAGPGAARAVFGRVDAEGATAQLVAIEFLDGLRGVLVRGEFDERESAWPPVLPIHRQIDVADLANLGEEVLH